MASVQHSAASANFDAREQGVLPGEFTSVYVRDFATSESVQPEAGQREGASGTGLSGTAHPDTPPAIEHSPYVRGTLDYHLGKIFTTPPRP